MEGVKDTARTSNPEQLTFDFTPHAGSPSNRVAAVMNDANVETRSFPFSTRTRRGERVTVLKRIDGHDQPHPIKVYGLRFDDTGEVICLIPAVNSHEAEDHGLESHPSFPCAIARTAASVRRLWKHGLAEPWRRQLYRQHAAHMRSARKDLQRAGHLRA